MIDNWQFSIYFQYPCRVGCKAYPIIVINFISLIFSHSQELSRYTLNHCSNVLLGPIYTWRALAGGLDGNRAQGTMPAVFWRCGRDTEPELHWAWSFRIVSVLWKITIYSFCSTYERKIEWVVISQKMDVVWGLCSWCGSGSVPRLRCRGFLSWSAGFCCCSAMRRWVYARCRPGLIVKFIALMYISWFIEKWK